MARKSEGNIFTEIEALTDFTRAEDYHQKYRLRNEPDLMREFRDIYPEGVNFVNSTAAARINGYLGGYGTPEQLTEELSRLGLTDKGKQRLISIISESRPGFRSCPI